MSRERRNDFLECWLCARTGAFVVLLEFCNRPMLRLCPNDNLCRSNILWVGGQQLVTVKS